MNASKKPQSRSSPRKPTGLTSIRAKNRYETCGTYRWTAVRDSFRRLAKAALDSQEDQPADLDWENAEPKDLDSRTVKAVTKDGTIVRGRTVALHGSIDQLTVEGILQPLLMRLPGEHWRLASGWKSLVFYNKTKEQ